MNSRILLSAALLLAAGSTLDAQQVRVREVHVQPLAAPDRAVHRDGAERRVAANGVTANASPTPSPLLVYPVAGSVGVDVTIPYYVDLDPSGTKRDFHCNDLTFNGHSGHDPYIRSFTEQRIGVPVFAVRDGVVIDVRRGHPDENTTNQTSDVANYVVIRHDDDEVSQYAHLRKDIPVQLGDTVTAGTQIGWVGSSGQSLGPHIHFEVRHNDVPVEPMAGPCRPGPSLLPHQPPVFDEPILVGTTFSNRSFGDFAAPPHDDAPHVATFLQGQNTIYFKAEVASVGASTRYKLLIEKPGSTRSTVAAEGTLTSIDTSLASIWWALDANLDRVGVWTMSVEINSRRVYSVPFTVVASQSEIVNRAPNTVTPEIEPVAMRAGDVAVCRAANPNLLLADPDFDVVRYRYEWRVNDTLVRDVTSAATTDALARQHVTPGAVISCSITPSDGKLSALTTTAHATPVTASKRRAVRK
jgi:Peptidase family M23